MHIYIYVLDRERVRGGLAEGMFLRTMTPKK